MPRETLRPASLRLWSGPPAAYPSTTYKQTYHSHILTEAHGAVVGCVKHEGWSQALARSCAGALARVRSLSLTLALPFRSFKVPSIVTPIVTSFHSDSPTIFLLFKESQVPVSVNGTLPRSFVISALTVRDTESCKQETPKFCVL